MRLMFSACCLGNDDHRFNAIEPIIGCMGCYKKNQKFKTTPKDCLMYESTIFLHGKSYFDVLTSHLLTLLIVSIQKVIIQVSCGQSAAHKQAKV